jgi:hypothetical protein
MKKIKNLVFFVTILTLINFSCKKDNASPTLPPPVGDTLSLLLGRWNVLMETDTETTNFGSWVLVKPTIFNFLDSSYSIFNSDGTYSEYVTYLDTVGLIKTFITNLYFNVKGDELDMSVAKNGPIGNRYFINKITSTDFSYYQTEIFSSTSLKEWLFLSR